MNKKGLSQVVTTIIMILLILVAIAGLWAVISNLIDSSTGKISTDQFTLSLTLRSASIDYDTGMAAVKVRRNQGEGNLVGIKFIVEDDRSSDIFEERFTSFPELAERTFDLNLTESEFLVLNKIHKISIAPIYATGTGTGDGGATGGGENIGAVSGSVTNLNEGIEGDGGPGAEEEDFLCSQDSDCGVDTLIEGSKSCDAGGTSVLQYQQTFSCDLGFCSSETAQITVEVCGGGDICYDGACIPEPVACTEATVEADCGVDGFIGSLGCHATQNATIQDYKAYSCVANQCEVEITSQIIEVCEVGEICFNGECFVPLECTQNSDCEFGEICEDGECVPEVVLNQGTIQSIWPFNVGEYFDSSDLPLTMDVITFGNYIIFPGSSDSGCYNIQEIVYPESTGNTYVRLNVPQTNITSGNSYQIWETNYACSLV